MVFLNQQKPSTLSGIALADATVFPVLYKGQRKAMPRTPKKRRQGQTAVAAQLERRLFDNKIDLIRHLCFLHL